MNRSICFYKLTEDLGKKTHIISFLLNDTLKENGLFRLFETKLLYPVNVYCSESYKSDA